MVLHRVQAEVGYVKGVYNMRLIDADRLKEDIDAEYLCTINGCIKQMIDEQVTVEAAPIKRGEWQNIYSDVDPMGVLTSSADCSRCKKHHIFHNSMPLPFCPNCGAKNTNGGGKNNG